MKNTHFIFKTIFVASLWLMFGFLNVAGAANYECGAAGEVQGCRVCRQTLGSGGNLAHHWADDTTRCAVGQACVAGACVDGQPLLPPVYDVTVVKSQDTAIVKDSGGNIIFSGNDYTQILRDAIAATPDHGSLYIGAGVYDGLRADQNIPINNALSGSQAHYYTALPLRGKNIHIYGAGMGQTVFKLGDNQYYSGHQALIFFASNGLGLGYTGLTLANMTLDGNKDKQAPFWYDGAGLILTGGERTGGKFFNLELQNSPNTGLYLGNNGSGWEAYAYLDNIYSHDNRQAGVVFDNGEKIRASRLKFVNDGTVASGTVALQIINVGDHKLDLAIDGAEINNGILKIGNEEYPGAGGITISNLKIDTDISNLGLIGAIYIKNNHDSPYSLADRGEIKIGISSITTDTASKNHAVWIEQEPIPVVLSGGLIDAGVDVYANRAKSVSLEGLRLKSSFNSLIAQDSKVYCNNCIFEPAKEQYMYSIAGAGAEIHFNNSTAVSLEKIDVSAGKVYGEITLNTGACNDECSPSGAKRCAAGGVQICGSSGGCLKWGTEAVCPSGQTCRDGGCVVAACTPETCASSGYDCGAVSDGCGGNLDCGGCGGGKTCSDGKCVSGCVPQTVRKCGGDGNLYWYDSCGVQGELAQSCGSDELTSNYRCSGNRVQRQILKRGCLADACFTAPEWQDAFDCSAGEACRDGDCVASETDSSSVQSADGGVAKIFSVTYEKYRVWIVAKIEGMRLRFIEITRQFFDKF
ncbi:MAG TPA: hypothetical protein PKK37_01675 [Candidatus Pacearchaeota archaeon]|nr:hypothetical protein [Candidatus Pacearchaeota archaeon]